MGSHNGSIGPYNQPLPSMPSPVLEDDVSLFIARHAYQARTAEDLSFEKGEKLKVHMYGVCGWVLYMIKLEIKGERDGEEEVQ